MYFTQRTYEELIEDVNDDIETAIAAGSDEITFYVPIQYEEEFKKELRTAGYPYAILDVGYGDKDSQKFWITW